jgi:hypothetical protein
MKKNFTTGRKSMKKAIIMFLLFCAVFMSALPAYATTCICIGANNQTGNCAYGGAGGAFLDVKPVRDGYLKYFLITDALQQELDSTGRAYDSKTGWGCWK